MKRLNGWQRIGVILSVLWIIGGGFLAHAVIKDDLSRDVAWQDGVVARLSYADQVAVKARDFSKMSDGALLMVKDSIDNEVGARTAV